MAASDAQPLATYGVAHRRYFCFKSIATGEVITGGLSTLAATISKDGGNFATCSGTPTEIQTSGFGYIDLTAAEMTATCVVVKITAAVANSPDVTMEIATFPVVAGTLGTTPNIGHLLVAGLGRLMNRQARTTATWTCYERDGTTVQSTRTIVEGDGTSSIDGAP